MKNLLLCCLAFTLFQIAYAQTPADTTATESPAGDFLSFAENYNAHAAYVNGNRWTTSTGNRSLGRGWKNVADEFKVSPEGEATFRLALAQRRIQPFYSIAGLGLMLGSLPLINTTTQFDWQTGLGIGMALGGFTLAFVGGKKARQSADNFERALWLRNRDEILRYTSPTYQPRLRYLYETETLYLTTNSYIKNGHEHKLGILGDKAAGEFRNIPTAWDMYKKYRTNQRLGAVVYAAGIAVMVASPSGFSSRSPAGPWMYFGGLVVSGAGFGIAASGRRFLREAVHLKNYTVLNQKMLRE
ncbi:hypothetical protein [Persicitalea jodogahamensis]|uniref:Uncharacterized protein n=1 Tax=Persicitalea jodogahamensis TaxID=402147 RepID=A0A8J3D5X9_9BACT|nr:hypothetical protein [Persicitalea jodogahamensis]GHB54600.1 hypothetical protein GCM10007390_04580 [Persicitalea jodogahamensis]